MGTAPDRSSSLFLSSAPYYTQHNASLALPISGRRVCVCVNNTDRVHEQVRTIKIEIAWRHNDVRARSPIILSGRQKKTVFAVYTHVYVRVHTVHVSSGRQLYSTI